MIDFELNEFGRRLGLPGLSFNAAGAAGVMIEDVGALSLESVEEDGRREVLVSLARAVDPSESSRYGRLLERTDWRRHPEFSFSAGLFRDRLIVSLRLEENRVTAAGLENALRFLSGELSAV